MLEKPLYKQGDAREHSEFKNLNDLQGTTLQRMYIFASVDSKVFTVKFDKAFEQRKLEFLLIHRWKIIKYQTLDFGQCSSCTSRTQHLCPIMLYH